MKRVLLMILLLGGLATSGTVAAQASANLGLMSEYIFRGVPQSDSSAWLGLDYESGGFYVGTWAADVGDGSEVDLYLGYGGELGEFSWGIGATGYFYTDDFDDTYTEINLSLGYSIATLDVAIGTYDNFSGPDLDYTFYSLTLEGESGFYGTIGTFGDDFDGEYFEAGYGTEIGGFEATASVVHSTEDLIGQDDTNIVLAIGKTFDL